MTKHQTHINKEISIFKYISSRRPTFFCNVVDDANEAYLSMNNVGSYSGLPLLCSILFS